MSGANKTGVSATCVGIDLVARDGHHYVNITPGHGVVTWVCTHCGDVKT